MNTRVCVSSNRPICWKEINFREAKKAVKKLQRRIYAACSKGNADKVVTLTHMMLHSFYAKAYAVKHVCSTHGKNTAGVDGVLWLDDNDKFNAIFQLKLRGYKPQPLKRIYIKKSNGAYRSLGIPTIKDRAIQTLYRFALEPVAEYYSDEHSYGYRPERSVKNAIQHLDKYLSENPEHEWILKCDIESCFDNISHEWLLENITVHPALLKKFLKAGFKIKDSWYPTTKGVPQGGSVSSTICNMTLDGLSDVCNVVRCNDVVRNDVIHYDTTRYADDFIIISDSHAALVQEVIPAVDNFLKERGLCRSKEKTHISDIRDGVCFLGWRISKENGVIKCEPRDEAIESLKRKIEKIMLNKNCHPIEHVKKQLRQVLYGWARFYSYASYPFFNDLGYKLTGFVRQFTGNRNLVDMINQIFSVVYRRV